MEEVAFYLGHGSPTDKHSQELVAQVASLHSAQHYAAFRQADCARHGAVLTGIGPGERLFVASARKALINVYTWGKDSVEQRIAVPEALACVALAYHPGSSDAKEPTFRVPWLLVGGTAGGRLYIWELASGALLAVKDAHYQGITSINFTSCGTFLVTASEDTRVLVWRTADLVTHDDVKPYAAFHDHSLAVTDVVVGNGLINDVRIYTASKDATVRVYDLLSKTLLTTFVLPHPVESVAKDPAARALYVGMEGSVRTIPLYRVSNQELEAVGGSAKIVTVAADPELRQTFGAHDAPVTHVHVSLDGTNLVSGDSTGKVIVSDIVTRQVVKVLPPCSAGVAALALFQVPLDSVNTSLKAEKKQRLIPPLKRVLASEDILEHHINVEITRAAEHDDFDAWLAAKAADELAFKSIGHVDLTITTATNNLEEKLAKLSKAYTELKEKHEQLLQ